MRAKLQDGKVCSRCNGTGTYVFKVGRYSYSAPCNAPVHTPLPLDPDLAVEPCPKCYQPTVNGNLSSCLECDGMNNACPDCINHHRATVHKAA